VAKVLGLADIDRDWLGQVELDKLDMDAAAERVASILAKAQIPRVGVAVTAVSAAIRASDLIVALVDDPNLNVVYEIGLAHAMHKPVVLVSDGLFLRW
jgi:hypothetical protein